MKMTMKQFDLYLEAMELLDKAIIKLHSASGEGNALGDSVIDIAEEIERITESAEIKD